MFYPLLCASFAILKPVIIPGQRDVFLIMEIGLSTEQKITCILKQLVKLRLRILLYIIHAVIIS